MEEYKVKVTQYSHENEDLRRRLVDTGNDNRSTNQRVAEYENKIALLSQEIERLNSVVEKKNNEVLNYTRKITDIEEMNKSIGQFQEKIRRLTSENTSMDEEMRNAQENLRLSANQNQRMMLEINEYKSRIASNTQENENLKVRIQKLVGENTSLSDEVSKAQEGLRLSSAAQSKLNQ